MMSAMTEEKASTWKKAATRMLAGALVGAGTMAAVVNLAGSALLDAMDPSRVALAAVGLIYAMMAALVGFGVAAPRAGAKWLNVGDAEELREERGGMLRSVAVMATLGVTLILLALARTPDFTAGPVPAAAAMAVLVIVLAGSAIASWRWQGKFDELNRQLGLEGCFWAFGLSWVGLTLWGAADFLGFGPALGAIDVVTTLSAMMLLGSFVAIGRRGMMVR